MKRNILSKKLLILLMLFSFVLTDSIGMPNKGFKVIGNIEGLKDSVVYFIHSDSGHSNFMINTVKSVNGHFVFTGMVKTPTEYYLLTPSSGNNPNHVLTIFIENKTITVNGTWDALNKAQVTGSQTQDDYELLRHQLAHLTYSIDSLDYMSEIFKMAHDTALANNLILSYVPFQDSILAIQGRFVKTHPKSIISAYLLSSYYGINLPLRRRLRLFINLDSTLQHSYYGEKTAEQIHWDTLGAIRQEAMDFTAKTMNGDTLSLSNYRGKYTLLYFWASWSDLSRKVNPQLKEIWETYKGKNFEIIGIADDDQMVDKWESAIASDKTGKWPNILRGIGTNQDLDKYFSIFHIPTEILINPAGKIIYRCEDNLNGLNKKLRIIFK